MRVSRRQEPIETWSAMKDKLRDRYVLASSFDSLLDDWHQFTQGTKSTKDYMTQFDEFLIRYNTFSTESSTQILSRFRAGLKEDLQTELLVRGIAELEKAYALVQDLDSVRTNYTFKSHDFRALVSRPSPSPQPNRSITQPPHIGMTSRARVLSGTKKSPEFPKVSSTTKCYKSQGYGN